MDGESPLIMVDGEIKLREVAEGITCGVIVITFDLDAPWTVPQVFSLRRFEERHANPLRDVRKPIVVMNKFRRCFWASDAKSARTRRVMI